MSETTRILTARITIIEKGDNICDKAVEADLAKKRYQGHAECG